MDTRHNACDALELALGDTHTITRSKPTVVGIGRHNVLDRLRGFVELRHIDVSQAVLVFSGRVPQSVIEKVHGLGDRFLASRALPTSLGVSLAEQYQITLACGLRPDSFKIFAHPERVLL